jgi:hypothetical protein
MLLSRARGFCVINLWFIGLRICNNFPFLLVQMITDDLWHVVSYVYLQIMQSLYIFFATKPNVNKLVSYCIEINPIHVFLFFVAKNIYNDCIIWRYTYETTCQRSSVIICTRRNGKLLQILKPINHKFITQKPLARLNNMLKWF